MQMPTKRSVKELAVRVARYQAEHGVGISDCAEAAEVSYAVIYWLVEEGSQGRRRMRQANFDKIVRWLDEAEQPQTPPPETSVPETPQLAEVVMQARRNIAAAAGVPEQNVEIAFRF
jgi:hypothetical protein